MKQIDALHAALIKAGLNAAIWRNQRIYINNLGTDITAYFTFDDTQATAGDNLLQDTALKVYSSCPQSRLWVMNRAKQVKHNLMVRVFNAGISKVEPPAEWREVIL